MSSAGWKRGETLTSLLRGNYRASPSEKCATMHLIAESSCGERSTSDSWSKVIELPGIAAPKSACLVMCGLNCSRRNVGFLNSAPDCSSVSTTTLCIDRSGSVGASSDTDIERSSTANSDSPVMGTSNGSARTSSSDMSWRLGSTRLFLERFLGTHTFLKNTT